MCLISVNKKNYSKEKIGYKILRKDPLTGKLTTPYEGTEVVMGKWLKCENDLQNLEQKFGYYPGWHYYIRKKDGLSQCIPGDVLVLVNVRNHVCRSTHNDIGVSKEIKIVKIIFNYVTDYKKRILKTIREQASPSIFKVFEYFKNKKEFDPIGKKELEIIKPVLKNQKLFEEWIMMTDIFDRKTEIFNNFVRLLSSCMKSENSEIKKLTNIRYDSAIANPQRLTPEKNKFSVIDK